MATDSGDVAGRDDTFWPSDEGGEPVRVFRRFLRCPGCDSLELKRLRTNQQGDGSLRRPHQCTRCGMRFEEILE
jgi:hypothetical protein